METCERRDRVHTILQNGTVLPGDDSGRVFDAVALRGNRVAALGRRDELASLAGPETEIVDLAERSAIPGIVDSHNHLPTAGAMMEGVLLFSAGSIEELKQLVADRARSLPPGAWVEGAGWIESQFSERRMPDRWDLDEAAPDHPVILHRLFGMSVANSHALRLAGIDEETPDPPRGSLDRDRRGRLTGILRAGAEGAVRRVLEEQNGDPDRRLDEAIERAAAEYVRWGITSVLDPGVSVRGIRAYQRARSSGRLPLRVNMMPVWQGLRPGSGSEVDIERHGPCSGFGDTWLRLGALKMAIDGGLGSRTALMHDPFLDGTFSQVPLRLDPSRLEDWLTRACSLGWSAGIHCCGDKAQDMACEAFDSVLSRLGRDRGRHSIIHSYFPTPRALQIMERWNIAVSAQPSFMWVEGDLYREIVPGERLENYMPLKTLDQKGILVACNSDMVSAHYNPFWGLHSAVTRKTARGHVMGERERLTRTEALRMFTLNGAWLMMQEEETGSLAPGKLADLAVLSHDFTAVSDDELRDLRVDLTIIDGEVVYRRETEM